MTGLVFGIDIYKGSVRSGSVRPRYAFIRVVDGKIESEERGISLFRLLRFIEAERPEIVAVDSVQEIAADTKELYAFLAQLPFGTKLVQVTGDGVRMESLPVVAARYNLKFDKTNPMEEAKASGLVASFGGGYEVIAFEPVTSVTVSRGRSLGRGGWSQNRYVRKVHGAVKVRAREIEEHLKEAGLAYSTSARRAFGGESRIVFTVNAPRRLVPAANAKAGDVCVKVEGRRKDRIEFAPVSKRPPYIIVGFDPGTSVGIAALDLEGNLAGLVSLRNPTHAEIVFEITKIGRPVLVATDKAEIPGGVDRVRRTFSAAVWAPKKDILIREKYEAVEGFAFKNDHERDSLSAAVYAFQSYSAKFDNLARRLAPGTDLELVKAGVIQGKTVDQILGEQKQAAGAKGSAPAPAHSPASAPEPAAAAVSDERDRKIAALEEEVQKLRELARSLSEELEIKSKAAVTLQQRLESERDVRSTAMLYSEEIESRDKELAQVKKALRKEERRCKNTREKLERMKRYVALQAGEGHLALKVLQQLSREDVRAIDAEMGVNEDDILYVLKIDGWGKSVVRDLAEAKIKAVILPRLTFDRAKEQHLIEEFREAGVALLSGADLSPRVKGKIGVVDEKAFLLSMEAWNKSQEAYLKEKKTGELHGMVAEYQVERRREVAVLGIDPESYIFKVEKRKPAPASAPVSTPKPKPKPQPVPQPAPAEKPALPAVPEFSTLRKTPEIKPEKEEEKPPEKNASEILLGVLKEYKAERKKELGTDE
ncbi:MAG TPA: DUF460 domain-containing protein [Methanocorpusculum sp.]|nr:DUF460 domain-containing protein [Methanocorpusculum sp.]